MVGHPRLRRPAPALVPGLLLPRRLRRQHGARVGLGGHPLLCQPPRVPCPWRAGGRSARSRAHLARGQRLAHPAPGRTAACGRSVAHRLQRAAHCRRTPRCGGGRAAPRQRPGRALAGAALRCGAAGVRGGTRGAARTHLPAGRRPAPAMGPLAGGQHSPRRAAARPPRRRPRMGQRALPGRQPRRPGLCGCRPPAPEHRRPAGRPHRAELLPGAGRPAAGP